MSDFDITSADETPQERARFGEALAWARQRGNGWEADTMSGIPNDIEGPSMADWLLRQRRARDVQVRRRTAVLDWSASAASTVLAALALLTPNLVAMTVCVGLSVVAAGILIGSLIRGAL